MLVHTYKGQSPENIENLEAAIQALGYKTTFCETQSEAFVICRGTPDCDIRTLANLKGVRDVHEVREECKLVSREWKSSPSEIKFQDNTVLREGELALMAGPCSIESEEQIDKIAKFLAEQGIKYMRGGVFKPRSSPYAFRGLGIPGLKIFSEICKSHGLKIVTEVMQVSQLEEMLPYVDVFQVGARNSQNYNLLDALGKVDTPVLLKRGISGTIEELLSSAEYIYSNGNEKIILCERGIRTYEKAYRNTMDINAIPILKEKSHLLVIADPSHGVGIRAHVPEVALASVMAGADGVIFEMHYEPEKAFSDGQQTLNFEETQHLIKYLKETAYLRKRFLETSF